MSRAEVSDADWVAASLLWDYHQMGHPTRPADAGIVLGCHDLGVADTAADVYHAGLVPVLVCSGADNPSRGALFPDGEAAGFRDRLVALGVPGSAVLLEPKATNTSLNITLSRQILDRADVAVRTVSLICMPYMQRRAYATCRKVWPEVDVVCVSARLSLDDYVKTIGDDHLVLDHLVGDLQRIMEYPKQGFAIEQQIPPAVDAAYRQLMTSGFTTRLMKP
jgi:uncharacterized SAM-binding protein YcdF (DUF218 family)